MAGGMRMALGSLISLVFRRKPLAVSRLRFAETLSHPNHIRGRDGQAFPLPSRILPARTRKTAMDGAIRIDSVGFSGKAAPSPFRRHCPNPLTDRSKPTEGRRCFYLAVAEPSLLPPKFARYSPPGCNQNRLAKRAILHLMAHWIATGFGHENHVGVRGEERFRAVDRHGVCRTGAH